MCKKANIFFQSLCSLSLFQTSHVGSHQCSLCGKWKCVYFPIYVCVLSRQQAAAHIMREKLLNRLARSPEGCGKAYTSEKLACSREKETSTKQKLRETTFQSPWLEQHHKALSRRGFFRVPSSKDVTEYDDYIEL